MATNQKKRHAHQFESNYAVKRSQKVTATATDNSKRAATTKGKIKAAETIEDNNEVMYHDVEHDDQDFDEENDDEEEGET